ncbi:S49 family peptidase [Crenobacter caeni]|uniref:S49 family peptidase n=1 Tax=Crenobacter caeni TaxID=2705474 RepID=A0A6B2KNA9_9NEIS|nr:S49 family peptidase [Crenobacter caeni]NDV11665.1 S49 family peptidase [Crenobacter caeni]
MKHHFLLHQLFNQPHMVLPDMLHEAVAWAGSRMGVNLHQVHVNVGAVLSHPQAWHDDGDHAEMISPEEQRLQAAQQTGVLVVPVYGVLVSRENNVSLCANQTSYESIRSQINAGVNDPRVEAIVLELDSPGGAVTGCFELVADIVAAKALKPIHAIVHFSAFSAAYAIASACTSITLSESAGVGSVGVIMKHADFSQQLAADGIVVTTFFRGARKNDLAADAPLTDEVVAVVDQRMDGYYGKFVDTVAANRNLSADAVRATEAGLFFGQAAIDAGLADTLESQQAAINRIAAGVASKRASGNRTRGARAAAAAMAMAAQL